jgi:toxin ParE1/3/4
LSYTVTAAPKARDDLREAADWYDEHHPAGADRFFEAFDTACGVLEAFPEAGRPRDDLVKGLRSYPVHPYVVFYVVDDERKRVRIARVLPGRSDITSKEVGA